VKSSTRIASAVIWVAKKKWYTSKTLWVNGVALVAIVVQGVTGFVVKPELQIAALGGINFLLRIITKEEVTW